MANEPKIISKVTLAKPINYETSKGTKATVGYTHNVIDKLIESMNDGLVVQVNTNLHGEQEKVKKLIEDVGNVDSGLVQSLNNLQTRVKELEDNTTNEPDWG
ncbi:hypothetical protein [Wolbachia endosymbiont (group A) of Limnophora tigrina]|uniref:hypothetical protein n=1 Tax=Wolbachia endosymbiont (group A) of Limnophora tigrina TaxID=3139318 RepID=UPI0035B50807